jgi:hypothetical protein
MRRRVLVTVLLAVALGTFAFAVESGFQTITIVKAEEKARDRVVYWVVDTPIYQEDPYFEVSVRAGDLLLVGQYEPEHHTEMFPDWKPGEVVRGRVEKHFFYLRRPNGADMRFMIVKRQQAR